MHAPIEAWEQELLDQVTTLARERFPARAEEADRAACFPHESMGELRALGIPGMALSAQVGGMGISPTAHMRIVEEVAYGDASLAVALNMHLLVADLLASIPMFARGGEVTKDIAANGAMLCAPGSIPTGELDNRKSGYDVTEDGADLIISGRSGFASNSDAAKYVFLGGSIDRGEDAEPDLVLAIPEKDTPGLTVMDNWDAMGLRGTASHDIVCEDLRIPRDQAAVIPAAMLRAILQGGQGGPGVMQNRARGALGILAIWLGSAQAAFDFTVEYVGQRHGYLAGRGNPAFGTPPGYRAEEAWAQLGIGEMDHWLGTGRVVFYDMVRTLDETFASPQEFTRQLTRTIYHTRRMSEEVSMGAMKVCGAHAYVKTRPLERIVRDMIGGNVMAWKTDQLSLMLGQAALGLPITITGPAGA
ncbi:MAG: acyl-CoA dehydrogenase family protein [Dehalococcoidia bacterium]|nr:acyl-CoA dehydrogenase family protein [Dehalococcoidia bacterium]